MLKFKNLKFLSAFMLSFLVFLNSVLPAHAATYLVLGNFTVNPTSLYLDAVYSTIQDGTTDTGALQVVSYEGDVTLSFMVSIQDYTSVVTADGYVMIPITFTRNASNALAYDTMSVSISNVSAPDGVSVSYSPSAYGTDSYKGNVYVGFHKFDMLWRSYPVSITFHLEQGARFYASQYDSTFSRLSYTCTVSDYASQLSLNDTPSYDVNPMGNIINSSVITVQQAVDNLTSKFTDAMALLNSNLQGMYDGMVQYIQAFQTSMEDTINSMSATLLTAINTLTADMDSKFEKLFVRMDSLSAQQILNDNKNHEDTVNGYDPATGDINTEKFDTSSAVLESVESGLTDQASYEIDYSSYDSIFTAAGTVSALAFVKTVLDSMYTALGSFAIPLTLGLLLLVITRILGYQNFSSGGG